MQAIAKGNYVSGRRGSSKAQAHVDYIAKRPGRDKEERRFFNKDREGIDPKEIKDRIQAQDGYVKMHRVMLSPGHNNVDLMEYARQTMGELGERKGQELEWFAVDHRNTDHNHIHVCVMGTDLNGEAVKLNSNDYRAIRAEGNRYLERNHNLDRYLDSEASRILHSKEYKSQELDKNWIDDEIKRFTHGNGRDKQRSEDALRDRFEWEILDDNIRKRFGDNRTEINRMTGKQYQTEMAGKHLEFHERAQSEISRERLEFLKDRPELAEFVAQELESLDRLKEESLQELSRKTDFDKLMNDMEYAQEAERIDYAYLFGDGPVYDRIEETADVDQKEKAEPEKEFTLDDAEPHKEPELDDLIAPKPELERDISDKDISETDSISRQVEDSSQMTDIGVESSEAFDDSVMEQGFDISGDMDVSGEGDRGDDSGY